VAARILEVFWLICQKYFFSKVHSYCYGVIFTEPGQMLFSLQQNKLTCKITNTCFDDNIVIITGCHF